jgi:hypothetical protein
LLLALPTPPIPSLRQHRDVTRLAEDFGLAAMKAEFGGVRQEEERALDSYDTRLCRCKVTCQKDVFINTWMVKDAVGCPGGGPVVAGSRQRRANLFASLPQQLTKANSLVGKLTPF